MIHRELPIIKEVKEAKALSSSDGTIPCIKLKYGPEDRARPLNFTSTIANYAGAIKHRPCLVNVEKFLRSIRIVPSDDRVRGITWLELYICYRRLGNPQPLTVDLSKANPNPSLNKQMREFKRLVRCIKSKALLDSEDLCLFTPNKRPKLASAWSCN